ncbi:MAG: metal/formaldehyde-sensitive transcriptional repressor [Archangium sp.]
MPHAPEDKKRVITRLRRMRGQTEALERAITAGTECGDVLQQLAALRGAATSLMAEVLQIHLRETFGTRHGSEVKAEAARLMSLVRSFLK